MPRDRNGSFEPRIVPKRTRRLGGTTDMILSLYARGMTTRDIKAHLAEVYGIDVSHETIAKVTEVVIEEIRAWTSRPVDEVFPIVFVDGIRIKVRGDGAATNKIAHLVVGFDVEGFKHVLGIWMATAEGSKFWLGVFTELRNRGLKDAPILCCDGLIGPHDAAATMWPDVNVQTCVVHLIRAPMKYVAYDKRKALAAAMKPIYAAPSLTAAEAVFEAFGDAWGEKYPGVVATWRRGLERVHPVPGPPRLDPPHHLYDEPDREHQLPAAQGNQQPGPLPQRRRRDQVALPRATEYDPERDGYLCPGTYGCKEGTERIRHRLPRKAPPLMTPPPHTENLTGPRRPIRLDHIHRPGIEFRRRGEGAPGHERGLQMTIRPFHDALGLRIERLQQHKPRR